MQSVPFHLGPNAWDSAGRLFALAYPGTLLVADSGRPEDLAVRHIFADEPADARGLFIAADGSLFVGLKGFKRGSFGRTMRSTDGGLTFAEVLDRCFWGIDQDKSGNLFVGCYHERDEPGRECAVYLSPNGGTSWVSLAAPEWQNQTHVHGLAVCPGNGWLYATLGDQDGLDGCWRMRRQTLHLAMAVSAGTAQLQVQSRDKISRRIPALLLDENGAERIEVVSCADGIAQLSAPLTRAFGPLARLELLDWVNKFCSPKADVQYVGIAFKDGWVYLSDDNPRKKNPQNAIVYRARDDGDDSPIEPEATLLNTEPSWGAFFLKKDGAERLWVAVRPFQGKGQLWCNENGPDWRLMLETPEEPLEAWRSSHTFRDMSYGTSGDGRCQFSPRKVALISIRTIAVQIGRTAVPNLCARLIGLLRKSRSARPVG